MSCDSFSTNQTYFQFDWPAGLTGLERITLTAKGELQRILSAYFCSPISIQRIWETPASGPVASASPETAITQTRRVNLMCEGHVVCVCISAIKITNREAARLFLEEKFGIGQMFRRLGKPPAFQLISVGVDPSPVDKSQEILWRTYKLWTEGFECEIKEVFPDRDMFASPQSAERWIRRPVKKNGDIAQAETPQTATMMLVY
ncbi:Branched-chain alpha-keto acid dehydrogenase E1-alpha subunit [Ceratobasidium theobromae]|uniref:Branched-chain alpha-keto acid dehydrogenase E1-alpha subunit n=1 Tax=Ceratobasidium theobromae TaxID=1582974 RepID=A0A5N5QXJ9_9AGAM|nr:Branched-chain alpha-keto acid dehydrogenase E1-alpha subunit [Ceratobasidium theobromae]